MKKIGSIAVLILSFFFFQACNQGGKGSKQEADSINRANKPLKKDASRFMVDAAMVNMAEIKLGTIAEEKAQSSRIKNFASMIVSDHKKASDKLQSLAQSKQVALPDSLDRQHQSDANDLRMKEGDALDQKFIDDMVDGHKEAIKEFQKAAKNVDNKDVHDYIKDLLPDLNKHLDSAEAIQDSRHNMNGDRSKRTKNPAMQ